MSLPVVFRPTHLYPRIKYGSPAVTIDFTQGATRIPTILPYTAQRGENPVASGKVEYLFSRDEERVGLVLRYEQDLYAAIRNALKDGGLAAGAQFNFWVDRFTGSCWTFENSLKDQNGLAWTLGGGSSSYVDGAVGKALSLSGSFTMSTPLAQASASTPTGFDDPLDYREGVIVLDVAPAFASSDGTLHFFLDAALGGNNRLFLAKNAGNETVLQITDSAGGVKSVRGTPAWANGERIVLVASWTTAGALALWISVNGGAFVALTTASGAGTGIMSALPTTLFLGNTAGTDRAAGTYDTLAIFKRAFSTPHLSLAGFRPVERNYFPYAELTDSSYKPARFVLTLPIWDWPITVRNAA